VAHAAALEARLQVFESEREVLRQQRQAAQAAAEAAEAARQELAQQVGGVRVSGGSARADNLVAHVSSCKPPAHQ
jgi:hypothetical protein